MENVAMQEMPGLIPPLPSEKLRGTRILLASNSPRRRELLGMIVPSFEVAQSREVEEKYPSDMPPAEVPAFLSRLKAEAYKHDIGPDEILITADTVVILDGAILGKPHDSEDAKAMLGCLSCRTHTVVTGVTLTADEGRRSETFSVSSEVTFAPLGESEINSYVNIYRPLDKAGSYGIQEWIGAVAIERISGSFYNVMGLPLHALYMHLRDF